MQHDVLIALGKNWEKGSSNLSIESKITALAAGLIMRHNLSKTLILSGGHTLNPFHISEAEAMYEVLHGAFPEVAEEKICFDNYFLTTTGNAINSNVICSEARKIKKDLDIALLTVGYHIPRAGTVFGIEGLDISAHYSSEGILSISPDISHQKMVLGFLSSEEHIKDRRQEAILQAAMVLDRKGHFIDYLATRARKY